MRARFLLLPCRGGWFAVRTPFLPSVTPQAVGMTSVCRVLFINLCLLARQTSVFWWLFTRAPCIYWVCLHSYLFQWNYVVSDYSRDLQTFCSEARISHCTTVRGPDVLCNVIFSWYVTFYQINKSFVNTVDQKETFPRKESDTKISQSIRLLDGTISSFSNRTLSRKCIIFSLMTNCFAASCPDGSCLIDSSWPR